MKYLANDLHWTDESEALQRLQPGARQRRCGTMNQAITGHLEFWSCSCARVEQFVARCHFSQLTPVYQKTAENFFPNSFP